MGKMSKKMMYASQLTQHSDIFSCPICQQDMHVDNPSQLVCESHHAFDIAKQGYINFLNKAVKTQYDKSLFDARQAILANTSLYQSVTNSIVQVIEQNVKQQKRVIIDMGSGEGSHLANITKKLNGDNVSVGFDIAKEAIIAATSYNGSIMSAVADISDVPIKPQQADVLLNILSPSNYNEFNRIIKNDGIIVKVVPNSSYLQEIRTALFESDEGDEAYSNEAVVDLFHKTYDVIAEETVHEISDIDKTTLQHLIKMTPLTWSASDAQLTQLEKKPIAEITIDLHILVGKKRLT